MRTHTHTITSEVFDVQKFLYFTHKVYFTNSVKYNNIINIEITIIADAAVVVSNIIFGTNYSGAGYYF